MPFTSSDYHYMQRALELAELGAFSADPNPHVGCVFVKDDEIIAEGWTQPTGGMHAEAMAINSAKASLQNSTCYVTLEPCSHHGLTPPCADALIKSNIKRLVVAIEDPNPQVAGAGLAKIKNSGISVEVGLMATEAAQVNRGFIQRMTKGLPFVTMKMGMSIDAKTAMASGESQWITCAESRSQVQRLRARSSAIITGRQTIITDNPSLNVRIEELPSNEQKKRLTQPIRVALDSNCSLSGTEQIFKRDANYLWLTTQENSSNDNERILTVPRSSDGKIELNSVLKLLAKRGCNDVLVEAGAELSGAFVAQDLVDEIQIFMAPVLLGHEARDLINMPNMNLLSDKKRYRFINACQSGSDVQLTFQRGD